jgi:hypothetical protein
MIMKRYLLSILALVTIGLDASAQTNTSTFNQTKKDTVIRSLPSPLPAPPFPSADRIGSPLVGVDATAPNYPLTKLLGLTKSKVKIYGWVDVGGNISSSKKSNAPTSYDLISNSVVQSFILKVVNDDNSSSQKVNHGLNAAIFCKKIARLFAGPIS